MKSQSVPGEPHPQSPTATATNRHQSSPNLPSQLFAVKAPSPFPVGFLKLGIRADGTPDCITSLPHIAFPPEGKPERDETRRAANDARTGKVQHSPEKARTIRCRNKKRKEKKKKKQTQRRGPGPSPPKCHCSLLGRIGVWKRAGT
jgi:hypothetical protein